MRTRTRLSFARIVTLGALGSSVAALSAVAACTSSNSSPPAGQEDAGQCTTNVYGAVLCTDSAPSETPDTGCLGNLGCPDVNPGPGADAGPDGTLPSNDGAAPDSGPGPGADASDGATAEDAGWDAGPEGTVTLTVTTATGPEQGVTVVFGDSTGAVLGTGVTNAQGVATGSITANGAVSVLFGTATYPAPLVVSILGAQPGDSLAVEDPSKSTVDAGSPFANLTGTPAWTFANQVEVVELDAYYGNEQQAWQGSSASTPGLAYGLVGPGGVAAYNTTTGLFPVLLVAYGETNAFFELGYTFQKGNVAPASGAETDVDMAGDTWAQGTTESFNVTNVPAGERPTMTLTYEEWANGVAHSKNPTNIPLDSGVPEGGVYTFANHPGYADFVQSEVAIYAAATEETAGQAVAVREAAPSANETQTFDLSQLIPTLNVPTIDKSVASRPAVVWSATAALPASAAGAVVSFGWSGTATSGQWIIVAPPTMTSVQAPALPAAFSGWAPSDVDSSVFGAGSPTALVAGGTAVSTYAQFRATYPIAPLTMTYGTPLLAPLAANGAFYVSGNSNP